MSPLADLITVMMARHFAKWEVAAVVGPTSAVAAELARRIHAPGLAVVGAMTALDTAAGPSLLRSEWGAFPSERHDIRDLFMLVAQGRVAIFTTPTQVDARGRANLGAIGGWARPKVALPGSRGLPDDAASLPGFAYWLPSARALVSEVDYVSAPPPPSTRERMVLTRSGVFGVGQSGWRCVSRHEEIVSEAPFAIAGIAEAPVTTPPSSDETRALAEIDPEGVRALEIA